MTVHLSLDYMNTILNRPYLILNTNSSEDNLNGNILNPSTHHYVQIPSVDFSTYSGFSIEIWFLWRGTNDCTDFSKTSGNCPGN